MQANGRSCQALRRVNNGDLVCSGFAASEGGWWAWLQQGVMDTLQNCALTGDHVVHFMVYIFTKPNYLITHTPHLLPGTQVQLCFVGRP